VKIELKSLLGGSGATLDVKVSTAVAGGSLSNPTVTAPGSGYSTLVNANGSQSETPGMTRQLNVKSGDIKVVNVDYGTGTSRAKDIR
jgi:hypothetical protein